MHLHGSFYFLNLDDTIELGDIARETAYTALSDYVDYGAARNMDWRLVGAGHHKTLGGWIGKTIREYNAFTKNQWPIEVIRPVKP